MRWLMVAAMGLAVGSAGAGEPAADGFAVVELFTSQGCSSCPPADRVLAELAEQAQPGVLFLSYHVTYWDYLGWRDPFGSASFDERQRRYARVLSERVYTPQMIVNGHEVFVGSNRGKAKAAIAAALAERDPAPAGLALAVQPPAAGRLKVSWSLARPQKGRTIHIALLESGLASKVTRGENQGKTLAHADVVRAFASDVGDDERGEVTLTVPPDLDPGKAQLVAILQDQASLKITGAVAVAFPES